jgi:hypothetical protein
MSNEPELTLQDFRKWLASLDHLDLIDAQSEVERARERKKQEGRVDMIQVAADGINVGWFNKGEIKEALQYLLENSDGDFYEVRIDRVRIPHSEVEQYLTNRWWPIGGSGKIV